MLCSEMLNKPNVFNVVIDHLLVDLLYGSISKLEGVKNNLMRVKFINMLLLFSI